MWLPPMPLVANGIVAVENGDPINGFVGPLGTSMRDRLREDKHGACGAGVILPQWGIAILR